jgi:Uma2 family endonuclease
MAGGSYEHNAVAGKLAMLLRTRLTSGCRYYTPAQRFWISPSTRSRSRYADGSVISGRPEYPTHDAQAATNPVIVVEVLSPSSEGDDDGEKRRDFQSFPSLQAYILVHQDSRAVRVYRRDERGEWRLGSDVYTNGETIQLPCLSAPIAVDEIYRDILDADGRSLLR